MSIQVIKTFPKDTSISCDHLQIIYGQHKFQTTIGQQRVVSDEGEINFELPHDRDFGVLKKGHFHINGNLKIYRPTYDYVPYITHFSRWTDIWESTTTDEWLELVNSHHEMYSIAQTMLEDKQHWHESEHQITSPQGYEFTFKLEVSGVHEDHEEPIDEDVEFERNYRDKISLEKLFPMIHFIRDIKLNISEDLCQMHLISGGYIISRHNHVDFMINDDSNDDFNFIQQLRRKNYGIGISYFNVRLSHEMSNQDLGDEALDMIELIVTETYDNWISF